MNIIQLAANIDKAVFSPDRQSATLTLRPQLFGAELSDLVESLTVFFGEERVLLAGRSQIDLSDLDAHLCSHLSRFGGHNLVLAKLKVKGPRYVQFRTKPAVNFPEVKKYFSKGLPSNQPKTGPECAARALAEQSKIIDRYKVTVRAGESYYTYDNRFGAAYAGAKNLPFPEFAQYLLRMHLETLLESVKSAVNRGNPLLLQELGKIVLNGAVEEISSSKKGIVLVTLVTEINPYHQIAYLERSLTQQMRTPPIQLNYNG